MGNIGEFFQFKNKIKMDFVDVLGYEGLYEVTHNGLLRKKEESKKIKDMVNIQKNLF